MSRFHANFFSADCSHLLSRRTNSLSLINYHEVIKASMIFAPRARLTAFSWISQVGDGGYGLGSYEDCVVLIL